MDERVSELHNHEIDKNDECDNSVSGCLSITTTTSTKNYDRIEVQKFKNQATSPNIPINEKEEIKREVCIDSKCVHMYVCKYFCLMNKSPV